MSGRLRAVAAPAASPVAAARDELLAAVGLLTRLPVRVAPAAAETTTSTARTGAPAFAVVGAGLGAVAALPLLALGGVVPLVGSLLALAVLAVATGALHLDGLADTADALAAPNLAAAEAARADPRLGAGGTAAIVIVIAIDAAALAALVAAAGPPVAAVALVVATAVSRATAVVLVPLATRGTRTFGRNAPEGFGRWFAARVGRGDVVLAGGSAAFILVAATVVLGRPELALAAVTGLAAGFGLALAVVRARRGLDGDDLGAAVELTFAAVLVAAAAALAPA